VRRCRRVGHGERVIGARGVAPTGKQVTWTQISVVRFSQGRIVEDWAVADELSILQQLGALPT